MFDIFFHIIADTKSETYKELSEKFQISFSSPLYYSSVCSRLPHGATFLQSGEGK